MAQAHGNSEYTGVSIAKISRSRFPVGCPNKPQNDVRKILRLPHHPYPHLHGTPSELKGVIYGNVIGLLKGILGV